MIMHFMSLITGVYKIIMRSLIYLYIRARAIACAQLRFISIRRERETIARADIGKEDI